MVVWTGILKGITCGAFGVTMYGGVALMLDELVYSSGVYGYEYILIQLAPLSLLFVSIWYILKSIREEG